jgi:hypothetical protein
LEVHLPFLQIILDDFKIVPLVAGSASAADVAEVIAALWDGPETRFIISSDLSHYHEYSEAQQLDLMTSHAIEALQVEDMGQVEACGRIPICGLLRVAREHGLCARMIDLRNSGDTAGSRDEVVGYGAFVLEAAASDALTTGIAVVRPPPVPDSRHNQRCKMFSPPNSIA